MLSVVEALSQILLHCEPLPAERIALSRAALGRVLAEDVASDLDMPPFDKALMDGYAVRSADLPTGHALLTVVEEITAGQTPRHALGPGQTSRIMTGIPIPSGADAVVVIERTKLLDDGRVEINSPARPEQNILRRGREMAAGEVILRSGCVLRPQEFGLLATVGRTNVLHLPAPRVAILATGDELVEAPTVPGPGQIRNGNAPMLMAQSARAGAQPCYLGIARDTLDSLRPLVNEGLANADVLVLTGGVSAGKLDLVPEVLRDAGVTPHFHKIQMKPGKPLFFGTRQHEGNKRLVFGLPGNPVSSLVCFELFLRPALRRLAGHHDLELPHVRHQLSEAFPHHSDRPTYHPATLTPSADSLTVRPVPWFGSADLRAFAQANALLVLPPGNQTYQRGDVLDVLKLDG